MICQRKIQMRCVKKTKTLTQFHLHRNDFTQTATNVNLIMSVKVIDDDNDEGSDDANIDLTDD